MRALDLATLSGGPPHVISDSPFTTQRSLWNKGEQSVATSGDFALVRSEGFKAEVIAIHHIAGRTLAICVEVNAAGIRPAADRDAALAHGIAKAKAFLCSLDLAQAVHNDQVSSFLTEWVEWNKDVRASGLLYDIRPAVADDEAEADQRGEAEEKSGDESGDTIPIAADAPRPGELGAR
jgi:hypothetical protein